MTGADGRSVGELLLDADHTARDLLIDAPDLDAAVVLRTWGEVVQTAADLWTVLPAPPAPAGAPDPGAARPDVMAQLVVMTDALTRGLRAGPWPGPGVTEPRLQHVADKLARAAQLVHVHAARSLSNHPAVRADVDAARTRIIHPCTSPPTACVWPWPRTSATVSGCSPRGAGPPGRAPWPWPGRCWPGSTRSSWSPARTWPARSRPL